MPESFTLTTPATTASVGSDGRAAFPITVTNVSGRPRRARLALVPTAPAAAEWFTIEGETVRDYGLGATESYSVKVQVPPGVGAGTYTVRADAVAEDGAPDVDQGPTVALMAAAPAAGKRFPWWILAVAAAVLAAVVVVAVVVAGGDDEAAAVTVPDVQGRAATVAVAALTGAGLQPSPPNANGLPCDPLVATQDPAGGSPVSKGTTVTLTFAPCGTGLLTVPDVEGQAASAAIARLTAGGFVTVPPDTTGLPCNPAVTSQRPAAGSPAATGTIVTLTFPACLVAVPNVQGQAASSAIAALAAAGFRPDPPDTTGLACDPAVSGQTPPGGASAESGATVKLTLAACPTKAIVPDVRGDTAAGASAALSAVGLRATTRSVVDPTCNDIGVVRSQTPGAGTEVALGSTVTISIGTPPPPPRVCP